MRSIDKALALSEVAVEDKVALREIKTQLVQVLDADGENGYNANSGTGKSGRSKIDIPDGVDSEARAIDDTKDAALIRRVKELRSVFTGDYARGNFGYAEINIAGLETKELYAHSKIPSYKEIANKQFARELGHICRKYSQEESQFKVLRVNKHLVVDGPGAYPRNVDTEAKMLETLARLLGTNHYFSGIIKICTELPPCPSCRWVIKQFNQIFPNVKIEVVHSDGNQLID